jgi:hypothetical protein
MHWLIIKFMEMIKNKTKYNKRQNELSNFLTIYCQISYIFLYNLFYLDE